MTDTPPLVTENDSADHPTVGAPVRRFDDQPTVVTNRGLAVPSLGFGTWQLDDDTAARMTERAIDIGYRHIDTAQMYRNEGGVGSGIAASGIDRDELFLTTKVDNDAHEPDDLVASVERSLDLLKTDHVDLLLIHWPVHYDRISATLAALAQVHAAGLARHIGVSNFTIDQLDHVKDMAPLEVLQVECHPFFQQRELRRWCVENDWVFTAYSPIAQGQVFDSEELGELAERVGCSPAQLALAWLIGLDNVTAIPRTSSSDHAAGNFDAATIDLGDEVRSAIDQLDRGDRLVDPDIAPWN